MKCIIKDDKIKRVSDKIADSLVKLEDWDYCNKALWKSKRVTKVKEVKEKKPIKIKIKNDDR